MAEDLQQTGLAFFGAVTASISHEIKNRMAIVNEQAGLLEDLVLMAERGGQIDLERLKRLSRSVKDQIAQGDGIIRTMNRFAHSVDTPCATIGLRSLMDLTVRLAARKAGLKGVALEVDPDCKDAELTTDPFALMNLIWLGIEATLETEASGGVIRLAWQSGPESVVIRIHPGATHAGPPVPEKAAPLAGAIGAEVVCDPDGEAIAIRLPKGQASRRPRADVDAAGK